MISREEKYISFFANLTHDNVNQITELFAEDAHFKDPFNDVMGADKIKAVFSHMFETTQQPKFIVNQYAINQNILLLQWTFTFSKKAIDWSIEGTSMVTYNDNDLVIEHIDYWDPAEQIYSKIGLLKPVMNFLRSKLSAN